MRRGHGRTKRTDARTTSARVEQRHSEDRVLDTGALRALAHPLRVQIYDILSQYGPQTASSLAERLGESSGSTSYHLRALAKHDLIRSAPTAARAANAGGSARSAVSRSRTPKR